MSTFIEYNRQSATEYARRWALRRNPKYFDFDKIGGDCTNFVSQSIHAGNCNMNYTKTFGWYYLSPNKKSPSWTGTNFLYKFLINNKIQGPFAEEVDINQIQIGDIAQLNFEDDYLFNHSTIITKITGAKKYNNILICSHSLDRLDEPLSSITFFKIRFLHILGSYK